MAAWWGQGSGGRVRGRGLGWGALCMCFRLPIRRVSIGDMSTCPSVVTFLQPHHFLLQAPPPAPPLWEQLFISARPLSSAGDRYRRQMSVLTWRVLDKHSYRTPAPA